MDEYVGRKKYRPIITEINEAIKEIESEGLAVTNKLIAEKLGVTKQYVHRTLKENNLQSDHRIDYIQRLEDVRTERYFVEELMELADFQGKKIAFMRLLKYYGIEFKKPLTGAIKKIEGIDTSKHTIEELLELIDYKGHAGSLRKLLNENNLPYIKIKEGRPKGK